MVSFIMLNYVLLKKSHSRDFNLQVQAGHWAQLRTQVSVPKLGLCLILHPPSRMWGGRQELGVREWWFPWTVPILDKWLVWRGSPSEPLYWDTIRPSNIRTLNVVWLPSFLMNISHRKMVSDSVYVLIICILIMVLVVNCLEFTHQT